MANQTLRRPGVYCITHLPSGLIYVGAALDVGRRWSVHRYGFRKGKHHSARMQELWNRDGEGSFAVAIVEDVPSKDDLLAQEQHWLDRLSPCNPAIGFNTLPYAHSTYGRVISAETRKKLSDAAKRKKLSPEHRAALLAANVGRPMQQRVKDILREISTGRTVSAITRAKIAAGNTGKKITDETKAKLSKALKGRKFSPEHKAALKGFTRQHTLETRAKISLAKKGIPRDPAHVEKTAAAHRGLKRSPDTCARISAALRGKPLSAEYRAKLSAGQRRRFSSQRLAYSQRIETMQLTLSLSPRHSTE